MSGHAKLSRELLIVVYLLYIWASNFSRASTTLHLSSCFIRARTSRLGYYISVYSTRYFFSIQLYFWRASFTRALFLRAYHATFSIQLYFCRASSTRTLFLRAYHATFQFSWLLNLLLYMSYKYSFELILVEALSYYYYFMRVHHASSIFCVHQPYIRVIKRNYEVNCLFCVHWTR